MPKRKANSASSASYESLWLDEAKSETSLKELFQKHGSDKKLKTGERLISAGKKVESIYYVLEGALAIERENGERLATIAEGTLAGELSFLTGSMPMVTVKADSGLVKVAELKITALQKLLQDSPSRAGLLYACLARELAHKVGAMNAVLKAHTHASGPRSAAADSSLLATVVGDGHDVTMDVAALRHKFGLDELSPPPELLGTASCVCAVERHSVACGEGQPSQVYLFSTHVCVQQGAFGMTHRFAIDLADVFAVLRQKSELVASAPAAWAPTMASKVSKRSVTPSLSTVRPASISPSWAACCRRMARPRRVRSKCS